MALWTSRALQGASVLPILPFKCPLFAVGHLGRSTASRTASSGTAALVLQGLERAFSTGDSGEDEHNIPSGNLT